MLGELGVVEVAHDRPDRRRARAALDGVDVDEAVATRGGLRRAVGRERGQDLPGEPRGVHELARREARMDVDAVDHEVGAGGGEGLVLQLARGRAVERVGADGPEALDVEQRRALPHLLVGREADADRRARELRDAQRGTRPRSSPRPCPPCRRRRAACRRSWSRCRARRRRAARASAPDRARCRGAGARSRRRRSRGARSARPRSPTRRGSCRGAPAARSPARPRRSPAAWRRRSRWRPARRRRGRSARSSSTSRRPSSSWPGVLGEPVLSRADCVSTRT